MKASEIIIENSLSAAAAMFAEYGIKCVYDNTGAFGELIVKYSNKAYDLVCCTDCEFRLS